MTPALRSPRPHESPLLPACPLEPESQVIQVVLRDVYPERCNELVSHPCSSLPVAANGTCSEGSTVSECPARSGTIHNRQL